jgi:hypothetical protein
MLYPEAPADKRRFIEYLFQCRADHCYVTVVTVRSIMSTRSNIPDSCYLDRVSRYQIDANAHVHMHMGSPFHSSAIHHGYGSFTPMYVVHSGGKMELRSYCLLGSLTPNVAHRKVS